MYETEKMCANSLLARMPGMGEWQFRHQVFRYGVLFRNAYGRLMWNKAENKASHLREHDTFVQTSSTVREL